MSLSFAGILTTALALGVVISKKGTENKLLSLFTINLLYEGYINIGYWGIIGSLTLKVSDFLQILMVLYATSVLLKKGLPLRTVLFVISIVISVLLLVIFPFGEQVRTFDALDRDESLYDVMHYVSLDTQCIKTSLRLICFAWNASGIIQCISIDDWISIRNKYFKVGLLVIGYAWIEFIAKNIFRAGRIIQVFLQILFRTSNVANISRNGLFSIVGLTTEPSQFTMIMFSYWLIYIIGEEWKNQTQYRRWLSISSIALMILSGSFRVVGMIPIILVMYMIVSKKPVKNILMVIMLAIIVFSLGIAGAFDYYIGRLGNVFTFLKILDATGMTGGEAGRLNTILSALRIWVKRPLFGIGPGETFAYGFIPSVLATMGIFGLIAWYKLFFGMIGGINARNAKARKALILLLVFSVSWIYTDSIAIGYSIYVVAMALEFKRQLYYGEYPVVAT